MGIRIYFEPVLNCSTIHSCRLWPEDHAIHHSLFTIVHSKLRLTRIVGIAFLTAASRAQETAPALPTSAEIRAQFAAGQYAPALKSLTRVLELKGPAAIPYNRPELLLLRGECLLQTRQAAAAKTALDAAFKESIDAGDSVNVGKCLALSALVAKSPNMIYTPKKGTAPVAPKPISILDLAVRPDAYRALFVDLLPETKNKARAAVQTESMTAVMAAARDVAVLRALEKLVPADSPIDAAAAADSQKCAADLLNHADILVSNSLGQMAENTRSLAALANRVEAHAVEQVDPVSHVRQIINVGRRRGLSPAETQSLKVMQQTSTQILGAITELAVEFATPETFKDSAAKAGDLQKAANSLLNDDYTQLQR